jgi:hypothetical protein
MHFRYRGRYTQHTRVTEVGVEVCLCIPGIDFSVGQRFLTSGLTFSMMNTRALCLGSVFLRWLEL